MTLTASNLDALSRQGRYAQVVADFDWNTIGTISQEHRLVLAHAAFHVGRDQRALDIATRENTPTAPPFIRSECEAVFGLLDKRQGDWRSATRRFQASFHWAKEARVPVQIGWASLRLFRMLAEVAPSDALVALSNEVRQTVARAADPHTTAYLHDSIALMEVSAGRIEEARRHVRITQGITARHPHAWLDQVVSISSFFLDFLECRYVDALKHLHAARELCGTAGEGLSPVIDCNEGHLLLVTGRYDLAERRLRKIAASDSRQFAQGALDGLARLYLATGRLDECAKALSTCESLEIEPDTGAAPFFGRRSAATRVRLLLVKGDYRAARSEAELALAQARSIHDRYLIGELSFLKAEALAADGDIDSAVATLSPFAITDFVATPGQQAAYYRALALTLMHARSDLSKQVLDRSRGIYLDQGNEQAIQELKLFEDRAATVLERRSGGRELPAAVDVSLINSLAAAVNLSHSTKLFGRELLHVIDVLDCSPKAELCQLKEGAQIPLSADTQSIVLGTDRGKTVALICSNPSDPLRAATLADVLRVANAIVALDSAKQKARGDASVWREAPPEPVAGAVFIADEMQALLATARRVATTNVPVLITGETGTGKEILARTIHACSNRSKATFLPFNCTSTPRDMLDSQLFGHRRGSFTGATDNFQGVIRAAAGGTLFLDEIGDMGLDVQPKLLRFLESGEVHPVGDAQPHPVDVRVIAATNANLDALVTDGRFREDLFYRLNIVPLHLPPLRERRVEIPAFANHYLQRYAQEFGKGDLRLAEETMEYLLLFRWPGNVRQLANEMRRMAALCEAGAVLMPEHLSPDIAASRRTIPASDRALDQHELVVRLDQPLAAATEHLERAILEYALKQCGGRMEETASLLGLSRKGLYLKRQRFGIEPPEAGARAVDVA